MDLQRVLSCPTGSSANDSSQFQGFQKFLDGMSALTLPSEPALTQPAHSFSNPPSAFQPRQLPPTMNSFPSQSVNLSSNLNRSNYGYPAAGFVNTQPRKSGLDIFPPSRNFRMDINSGMYAFRPTPAPAVSVRAPESSSSAPADLSNMPNYPQFTLDRSASMPVPLRLGTMPSFQQDLEIDNECEKITLPSFQSLTRSLQLSPHSRPLSSELPEALALPTLQNFRSEKKEIPQSSQETEHLMVLEEQKEFLRQAKLKEDMEVEKGSVPMETSENDWIYQQPVSYQESFEGSLGQFGTDNDFQIHQMKIQRASSIPTGRICRYRGCTKTAQTGGFCRPHGGGSRCKHPGCTKCAQKGGFCTRHGGGVRCGVKDCPKGAQVGGFCVAHGGGRRCKYSGCTKAAQKGSYCVTHGGAWRCKVEGCEKLDAGRGLCIRHGDDTISCFLSRTS
jgi:hypothetical protein